MILFVFIFLFYEFPFIYFYVRVCVCVCVNTCSQLGERVSEWMSIQSERVGIVAMEGGGNI